MTTKSLCMLGVVVMSALLACAWAYFALDNSDSGAIPGISRHDARPESLTGPDAELVLDSQSSTPRNREFGEPSLAGAVSVEGLEARSGDNGDHELERLYAGFSRDQLSEAYLEIKGELPAQFLKDLHKSKVMRGEGVVVGTMEVLDDGRTIMPVDDRKARNALPFEYSIINRDGQVVETWLSEADMAPYANQYRHLAFLKKTMAGRKK